MKNKFITILLGFLLVFLLTACVKDNCVILDKKCIHHTIKSDNYYFILQCSDGGKIMCSATESEYVLYNVGDTIELWTNYSIE